MAKPRKPRNVTDKAVADKTTAKAGPDGTAESETSGAGADVKTPKDTAPKEAPKTPKTAAAKTESKDAGKSTKVAAQKAPEEPKTAASATMVKTGKDATSAGKKEETTAAKDKDGAKKSPEEATASGAPDKDGKSDAGKAAPADQKAATVAGAAQEKTNDAPTKMPTPQREVVQGSIWPGFFGGVIAALIGFIVGRGDVLDQYLPSALQRPAVDLTEIEATVEAATASLDAQATQLEAQAGRLAELEAVTVVAEDVSALESQIVTLNARIDELESRPVASGEEAASPEALAALESTVAEQAAKLAELAGQSEPSAAVEALESALAEQEEKIAELVERAEAAEGRAASEAQRILARAALARVETAVDSGEGFSTSLEDLEEVAPVEVPSALREAADAGVPTLASLQDSFPDAARAGLAAARSDTPVSDSAGITSFLKRQLNVRSVTPREGSDPDAVLSRAQAAVRAGDLETALTEMESLPDAARTAMSDWLEAANARKAAQDAASEMADSLNTN